MSINFETFEEEHGADLKKYIRSKMLGEYEYQDHDDVWQEMLVKLIERDLRDDLPPIENAKEYAFIVLRGVVNDYISDKLNREDIFVSLEEVQQFDSASLEEGRHTPWGRMSSPEDQAIFNEAIENLTEPAAQAYEAIEQGYTVAEQAALHSTSERMAKRNRARLRDELQEVAG